ncbi:DUF397 domain-containing protein [Spirillospora sp. CA-294931]|uniref:DUF397 domain-containing protein n=1 Tax=Spirillospora sp. CA-294931 TaxID=3240042 RepID=UPI003D8FC4F8
MTEWRKSSRSSGIDNSDCVEVAEWTGNIAVRDSKAPGAGVVVVSVGHFADLVARVKRAELDL